MICLSMDTIDGLILCLRSEEEHDFDFYNMDFNENIFQDSKIDFQIIMQQLGKINDHKYTLV